MKSSFLVTSIAQQGAIQRIGLVKAPATNPDQFTMGTINQQLPLVVISSDVFFEKGKTYDFTVTEASDDATAPAPAVAAAPATVETLGDLQNILFQAYKTNYALLDPAVKADIVNVVDIGNILKNFTGNDETSFYAEITAALGQTISDQVKSLMGKILTDLGWQSHPADMGEATTAFLTSISGAFGDYRQRVAFEFKVSLLIHLYTLPIDKHAAAMILSMHDNYSIN